MIGLSKGTRELAVGGTMGAFEATLATVTYAAAGIKQPWELPYDRAVELWAALAGVTWIAPTGAQVAYSWWAAAELVTVLRASGLPQTVYEARPAGVVAMWIAEGMGVEGWSYVVVTPKVRTEPVIHLRYGQMNPRTACGLVNVIGSSQHPALVTCAACRAIEDAHPERSLGGAGLPFPTADPEYNGWAD